MPDTLPDLLAASARRHPDAVALRYGSETWTYPALDAFVGRAVAGLRAHGVQTGDRVALRGAQTPAFLALIWACFRLGAVAAPLSTRWPDDALSGPLDLLAPALRLGDLPDALPIDAAFADDPASSPTDLPTDRPATAVFTSGSTGTPKAAIHSYGNHVYSARGANANIPLAPGDAWLLSLPLYHVGGLAIFFRCWAAGATVALPTPGQSLDAAISAHPLTHVSLVATQLRRLLADDVAADRFKAVLIGGSAIPPGLVADAHQRGWPLHTSYGLTEMASQVATTPTGADLETLATAGRALPHRELRIHDGDIHVRGATRFLGYLQPDSTLRCPFDDGWFATGDIGHLDALGRLHVTGRRDAMFISGGENVHPEQVEQALLRLPAVARVVVAPVPDAEFGQRPIAFVQWHAAPQPFAEVRATLHNHLPRFMHPDALLPWPADPGVEALKIKRAVFQRLALEWVKGGKEERRKGGTEEKGNGGKGERSA